MPVIKTERNFVIADEPEPDDLCVRVSWLAPTEEGLHLRTFNGPMQPIEEYDEALAWAVSMADQMEHRMFVLPFNANELMKERGFVKALASLSTEADESMRQFLIAELGQIMRRSDEPEVRASAHEVLQKMEVF